MESFELKNPTDEQKNTLLRIGMITIAKTIFEGLDSVEKIKKNLATVSEKTGLSEQEIWEAYEFTSQAVLTISRPKQRSIIGFKP
jgi:hypothetical protein